MEGLFSQMDGARETRWLRAARRIGWAGLVFIGAWIASAVFDALTYTGGAW